MTIPQLIHSLVNRHLHFSNILNSNNINSFLYMSTCVHVKEFPYGMSQKQSCLFREYAHLQPIVKMFSKPIVWSTSRTWVFTLLHIIINTCSQKFNFFLIKWVWNMLHLPAMVETAPPNFLPTTIVIVKIQLLVGQMTNQNNDYISQASCSKMKMSGLWEIMCTTSMLCPVYTPFPIFHFPLTKM